MTLIELFKAFAQCVAVGHDWQDDECARCGAKKDGPTLLSLLRKIQAEMAESSKCYCHPCWESLGRPSADFYAPSEKILECCGCDKEVSVRDLVWVRVKK